MGEGADDAVHETVNGADGKVGIVVQDGLPDSIGIALQGVVVQVESLPQVVAHWGVGAVCGNVVQFAKDTFLHFVGGFVGEGDGKDAFEPRGKFPLAG